MPYSLPSRILIIAGSDSGGGAGIQADIKTVTMLGGYATTAVTALTAQDTLGVHGIWEVPDAFIHQQITLVLADIGADVIKTGMLQSASVIRTVAEAIAPYRPACKLVIDPVMVAKGGTPLLQREAITTLQERLLPGATLITPNIPEAELLTGISPIRTVDDMVQAGRVILGMGVEAVVVKGGHLEEGDTVHDVLITHQAIHHFTSPRIITRHTHGTGCTLASAISTFLGQGCELYQAVEQARAYVYQALVSAPGLGHGHGPLNHGWPLSTQQFFKQ